MILLGNLNGTIVDRARTARFVQTRRGGGETGPAAAPAANAGSADTLKTAWTAGASVQTAELAARPHGKPQVAFPPTSGAAWRWPAD